MRIFIGYIPLPIILTLVIQIIAGATIFIALSAILKLEEFEYLTGMIKSFLKDKEIWKDGKQYTCYTFINAGI